MKPRLAFGSAPVLGRHTRATSVRAIQLALDAGVRHFDTARSYGWGEAEKLLGEVIKHVPRDELFVVSKCGIVPVKRARWLGLAKTLARQIISAVPAISGPMRKAAAVSFQPARTYDVAVLEASFRTSLEELDTDYLDVLLLHNFEIGKDGVEEVVHWMRGLQQSGKIRKFGFAVGGDVVEAMDWLADKDLLDGAIIQTPLTPQLLQMPARYADQEMFVFSIFRCPDRELAATACDLRKLSALLSSKMRCGAIICSMFSEHHIRENAAALR